MRNALLIGSAWLVTMTMVTVLASLTGCGDDAKPAETPATQVVTTPPAPPAATTAEAPKEAPKPQPSLTDLERTTGEGIGQAINAHDAKKIASFYTESALVKAAGFPDLTGRDAIAADWQQRFDRMAASKATAIRVFVKGDVVITEWAWTATASPEKAGGKGPDKQVGAAGVDVMWFSPEGLVKEQHTYTDLGTILSQLGVSKQKARPVPTLNAGAPTMVLAAGGGDETRNADVVTKIYGAFEKKSEADFLGNMTDDVAWDDLTQPETMKGKAQGKKYFGAVTTAFPDAKVTVTNTWAAGDFVVLEETLSGTHKAPFFGIPATKKAINVHSLDIVQLKDGKVVAGKSYGNSVEMMTQLGLVPPPPAPAAKK